jgi:hypothetical protein
MTSGATCKRVELLGPTRRGSRPRRGIDPSTAPQMHPLPRPSLPVPGENPPQNRAPARTNLSHDMASSRNPVAESAEAQAPNPRIPPGDPPSPEMEATAEALTREEVLRRRRRRATRLAGVYRRLYWAMAEEVRAKHRQYVWDLGRSPLEAGQPLPPPGAAVFPGNGEAPRPAPVPRRKKCGFTGCKVRAMAMTKFCHSHILSDPNQALYKPCTHVMKRFVSWMLSSFYTIWRPYWRILPLLGFQIQSPFLSGSRNLVVWD